MVKYYFAWKHLANLIRKPRRCFSHWLPEIRVNLLSSVSRNKYTHHQWPHRSVFERKIIVRQKTTEINTGINTQAWDNKINEENRKQAEWTIWTPDHIFASLIYSDDDTSDCWSVFSHLIIGGDDDDVETTFIFRIHGMILWICTEPEERNESKAYTVIKYKSEYQLTNQTNKEYLFDDICIEFR